MGARRTSMMSVDEFFKGRHLDRQIIILCVRRYLQFKLSFRDLVEMMTARGVDLARRSCAGFSAMFANSKSDETDVKVKGNWTYRECFCSIGAFFQALEAQSHSKTVVASINESLPKRRRQR
jgi:hypothetical protein